MLLPGSSEAEILARAPILPRLEGAITVPLKIQICRMKKRILYTVLLTALGLNLAIGAQIYLNSPQAADKDDRYQQLELFTRVLEKVRQEYVDPSKVSYDELISGAIRGMMDTLDPHSEFMEPQKYKDLKDDTEGSFGGVGIVIEMRDKALTVVAPMEDTPAFRAGVQAGDRIVKINGQSAANLSLVDAVKILRGKPGTDVTISIARESLPEPKDFTLTRAEIKVDTVKDINGNREFPLGPDKIGYVHVNQFGEQTSEDLERALNILKRQGMKGFVLDLRNNPGGLLDQAVRVCDLFLPRGQLIVSTEGSSPLSKYEYHAKTPDQYPGLRMVVLVNGGSASAAEIVSGCLQDVGRAFVMGEQTFGKGSVQSIIPMPENTALRLTTAKYYTPSHKVIHEKGITPDSVVAMTAEEETALGIQRLPGGLDRLPASERAKVAAVHDIQLERAEDFLKGMILLEAREEQTRKVAAK